MAFQKVNLTILKGFGYQKWKSFIIYKSETEPTKPLIMFVAFNYLV